MNKLLKNHKLKLILARQKKIIEDTFDFGMGDWNVVSGDFHHVTVDTNADEKTGIEGGLLIDAAGSYEGGIVERTVTLKNYGEIVFERYVKNDEPDSGNNKLNFYIDGVLKLSLDGPTPWRRIEPIGISPGSHTVRFEYIVNGPPNKRSGIFDTFTVWEGKTLNTLITKYNPPRPSKNVSQSKTLRGHTRYQEMLASDTEINFSVMFDGPNFLEFIANNDDIFYFIDEFGICYRGLFPTLVEPESKALNHLYIVNLLMQAPQKAGVGFV